MTVRENIIKKYHKHISKIVRAKYKKIARREANIKKIYLKRDSNVNKQKLNLENEIYLSYLPIIEEEIKTRLDTFIDSEAFINAVNIETKLNSRKLSYKNLKKYQEFPINIDKNFIDMLYKEVNVEGEPEIKIEELKYIVLLILYKIIDFIKLGYMIKVGTLFNIWLDKRDIRINLPNIKENLLSDRLIPKIKLCKNFDRILFLSINKDNNAIINYYKAKAERYLSIFKKK